MFEPKCFKIELYKSSLKNDAVLKNTNLNGLDAILEKGINSNADERAIVMHGADYVSENYIRTKGYIGRSWGCPAVPEKLNKPIIETIKNGTCLFIFGANNKYIKRSKILNS